MTTPTAHQLIAAQSDKDAQVCRELENGPATAIELAGELGATANALTTRLSRMLATGKVVKLWRVAGSDHGGPKPWMYGLPDVDYGKPPPLAMTVPNMNTLRGRVLAEIESGGAATTAELGAVLGYSSKSLAATISDLRRDGKIRRAGVVMVDRLGRGGAPPFLYALGAETDTAQSVPAPRPISLPAPPRKPDPARIAGPVYMRQFAMWGQRA